MPFTVSCIHPSSLHLLLTSISLHAPCATWATCLTTEQCCSTAQHTLTLQWHSFFLSVNRGSPPPSPECQCTVWISISVCHHHIEHVVFKKEWLTSDRTSFLMIKWFFWTEAAEHKNKNKRGIFEIILIINNPVQKLAAINEYCTD